MKRGATDNTSFPGQSEANLIIIFNTLGDKNNTGAVDKFGSYWDENLKKMYWYVYLFFILTVEKM